MIYNLFTDGGARGNPGPAATGVFLYDEGKKLVDSAGTYLGTATNNVAEYSALIEGLKLAQKNGATELKCHLDSELVVKQLKGLYKVKHPDMKVLHTQAKALLAKFAKVEFIHVPREQNAAADAKVNEVLDFMK